MQTRDPCGRSLSGIRSYRVRYRRPFHAACLLLSLALHAPSPAASEDISVWRLSCVEDGQITYLKDLPLPPHKSYQESLSRRFPEALCMISPMSSIEIGNQTIDISSDYGNRAEREGDIEFEAAFRGEGSLDDEALERALHLIFADNNSIVIPPRERVRPDGGFYRSVNTEVASAPLFERNRKAGSYIMDNDFFWQPAYDYSFFGMTGVTSAGGQTQADLLAMRCE